jgi:hypothetical protein
MASEFRSFAMLAMVDLHICHAQCVGAFYDLSPYRTSHVEFKEFSSSGEGRETFTLLCPLQSANLNHCLSSYLELRTMDKVQEPCNSELHVLNSNSSGPSCCYFHCTKNLPSQKLHVFSNIHYHTKDQDPNLSNCMETFKSQVCV